MKQTEGPIKTAERLREAYMQANNEFEFVEYCEIVLELDTFTGRVFWEVIGIVGDMGVAPESPVIRD